MLARHQTENETGEYCEPEREGDDRPIHADVIQPGDSLWLEADQQFHTPHRHEQTEPRSDDAENHAFCEQLTDQAAAPGTERRPNGHFRLTRRGPREQQVRDVRACNQQHEPDRAEQHEDCLPDVTDCGFVQRNGRKVHTIVRVRVLLRELFPDRLHLGFDPLDRDASLRTADHGQIPRATLL